MIFDHPLIGRRVRFGGRNKGIEGILLGVRYDNFALSLMLERIEHPYMPDESDGARPIVFVLVDFKAGDEVFVEPEVKPDPNVEALRKLVRDYFAASREWSLMRRQWRNSIDPDPVRDAAKAKLDTAFFALQGAVGKDIERG